MQLITRELRRAFPTLRVSQEQGLNAVALAHYFTPDGSWDWYAAGFNGDDILFGLVKGFALEYGSFSLSELQAIRGHLGLPIERDRLWRPTRLGQIEEMWRKQGFSY